MSNLVLVKKQDAQTEVLYADWSNFAVTIFSPDGRFYLREIGNNIRIQNSTRLFELKCYDMEQLIQDVCRQVCLVLGCNSVRFRMENLCYVHDDLQQLCIHRLAVILSVKDYDSEGYPGYEWVALNW